MNKADLTRWSWVEIDRGALRRNTRAYKNLLNPRQRLCCVVKADAYGHGAVECAKIMYSVGADMFAVATVNEGVELRQGGITKPILILSEPPIEAIPTLLEFDIMPSVYTSDFSLAYGEFAVAAGKVGKYHLAIESCMIRIGVHYTHVLTQTAAAASAITSVSHNHKSSYNILIRSPYLSLANWDLIISFFRNQDSNRS